MCRRQSLLTQSSWLISGRLAEPRRVAGRSSHDEGVGRGGSHKRRRSSASCGAWQDSFEAVAALGRRPCACAQVHIDELRGGRVPATAGTLPPVRCDRELGRVVHNQSGPEYFGRHHSGFDGMRFVVAVRRWKLTPGQVVFGVWMREMQLTELGNGPIANQQEATGRFYPAHPSRYTMSAVEYNSLQGGVLGVQA